MSIWFFLIEKTIKKHKYGPHTIRRHDRMPYVQNIIANEASFKSHLKKIDLIAGRKDRPTNVLLPMFCAGQNACLWLHNRCSPPSSIMRREGVWSLPRPSPPRSTPTTTRSVVPMACTWSPWPRKRSAAPPLRRALWSARSPSVTLTSTTNPEDKPSTRSISAFSSRSNVTLGSS